MLKQTKAKKVAARISSGSLYLLRKMVANYDASPEMDADELIGRLVAHVTGTFFKMSPEGPPPEKIATNAESIANEPLESLKTFVPKEARGKPKHRRFKSYKEYMASREWRIKRQEAIRTRFGKCDVCGATNDLRVSHRHFKTLYRETPQDLDVLCQVCHRDKYEHKHLGPSDAITEQFKAIVAGS